MQGSRDLAVEIWIAPTLQYLPVRLRIQQDAETFVDLMLSRLPQQASAPASAASPQPLPTPSPPSAPPAPAAPTAPTAPASAESQPDPFRSPP
jgi:hypothetical protein